MTATDEQMDVLEAFKTGEGLTVEAAAGAAKTTTLRFCAANTDRKGLYVAFNRAIADEARASFTDNVFAATAHSIAYRAIGYRFRDRMDSSRMTSKQVAEVLGIKSFFGRVSPYRIANVAVETVVRFCHTSDESVLYRHVPKIEYIDWDQHEELAEYVLPFARRVWEDAQKTQGRLMYNHDYYLKTFCMSDPQLEYDFILLDESQDLNGVLIGLMESQKSSQLVVVGDPQQQIYSWRGAVSAMSQFDTPHRRQLTMSFRFGQEIADAANEWLEELDATLRVRGCDKDSRVGVIEHPTMILCRTNAVLVRHAMAAQTAGKEVAVVGGTNKIKKMALAALDLQKNGKTSHPDLFVFKSWKEVQEYVIDEKEEAGELGVFVRVIDDHGAEKIIQACDRTVDQQRADLVLSTTHKFKGLEHPSVTLADDFLIKDTDEERRLCYVAVTRAKDELDRRGLDAASKKSDERRLAKERVRT